jgi:hypothetical protein
MITNYKLKLKTDTKYCQLWCWWFYFTWNCLFLWSALNVQVTIISNTVMRMKHFSTSIPSVKCAQRTIVRYEHKSLIISVWFWDVCDSHIVTHLDSEFYFFHNYTTAFTPLFEGSGYIAFRMSVCQHIKIIPLPSHPSLKEGVYCLPYVGLSTYHNYTTAFTPLFEGREYIAFRMSACQHITVIPLPSHPSLKEGGI